MKVYCVMELDDDEYGYRIIESICATYEQAETHIKELGQKEIKLWNGVTLDLYTIQEYQVHQEELAKVKYLKDEIRKETAKEILQAIQSMAILYDFRLHLVIDAISQKYGVEVEE